MSMNDLLSPTFECRTALHVAAKEGRVDVSRILVSNGANVLLEDTDGRTPKDIAERYDKRKFLANLEEIDLELKLKEDDISEDEKK